MIASPSIRQMSRTRIWRGFNANVRITGNVRKLNAIRSESRRRRVWWLKATALILLGSYRSPCVTKSHNPREAAKYARSSQHATASKTVRPS